MIPWLLNHTFPVLTSLSPIRRNSRLKTDRSPRSF